MSYTETAIKTWMLERLEAARNRRDWASLPSDFEGAAVSKVYDEIKAHFGSSDIKERIAASKSRTFYDLEHALVVRI